MTQLLQTHCAAVSCPRGGSQLKKLLVGATLNVREETKSGASVGYWLLLPSSPTPPQPLQPEPLPGRARAALPLALQAREAGLLLAPAARRVTVTLC